MQNSPKSGKKRRSLRTFFRRDKTASQPCPPSPSSSSSSSNESTSVAREVVFSEQLEESFDDWLVNYAKSINSGNDIEHVEMPVNFANSGYKYCPAPCGPNESERARVAEAAERRGSWQQRPFYVSKLGRLIERHGIQGLSVSSLLKDIQKIHYQHGVGDELKSVPRAGSLDAHAALSPNGLQILNTSVDWRFKQHPLVQSPPYIRYYHGFPIKSRDGLHVLGCIAIFSPFAKQAATQALIDDVLVVAAELSALVDPGTFDFELDDFSDTTLPVTSPNSPPASPNSARINSPVAMGSESTVYQALYSLPTNKQPRQLKPASPNDKIAAKISMRSSASSAIKLVCDTLLADLCATEVYVVEMRILSTYICSSKVAEFESGTLVSNVAQPEKVFAKPLTRNRARSRITGRAAANLETPSQAALSPEQLINTLTAPIGLRMQFAEPVPLHVVAIPFARQDPTITIANTDKGITSSSHNKMLEVDSGGYILVVSGEKKCSTAESAKIRHAVRLLAPVVEAKTTKASLDSR